MIRALILLLLAALPARAEEIVAGFSQDRISITARFDGSDILVFGAVRREEPVDTTNPLGVIVTVEGPAEQVMVRRKTRQFGIWMNTEKLWLASVPSFYSVNSTWPISLMLTPIEDQAASITVPRHIFSFGRNEAREFEPDFVDSLIRIRGDARLYQLNEGAVSLEQSTLFQTSISMPATLVEGDYTARIFLTRNGKVVDQYQSKIGVYKVGLERWLQLAAHQQPLAYGLAALLVATLAGWGASAIFRAIRP